MRTKIIVSFYLKGEGAKDVHGHFKNQVVQDESKKLCDGLDAVAILPEVMFFNSDVDVYDRFVTSVTMPTVLELLAQKIETELLKYFADQFVETVGSNDLADAIRKRSAPKFILESDTENKCRPCKPEPCHECHAKVHYSYAPEFPVVWKFKFDGEELRYELFCHIKITKA